MENKVRTGVYSTHNAIINTIVNKNPNLAELSDFEWAKISSAYSALVSPSIEDSYHSFLAFANLYLRHPLKVEFLASNKPEDARNHILPFRDLCQLLDNISLEELITAAFTFRFRLNGLNDKSNKSDFRWMLVKLFGREFL